MSPKSVVFLGTTSVDLNLWEMNRCMMLYKTRAMWNAEIPSAAEISMHAVLRLWNSQDRETV